MMRAHNFSSPSFLLSAALACGLVLPAAASAESETTLDLSPPPQLLNPQSQLGAKLGSPESSGSPGSAPESKTISEAESKAESTPRLSSDSSSKETPKPNIESSPEPAAGSQPLALRNGSPVSDETLPILSLQDALKQARERNPNLQAAKAQLAKASELSAKVLAAYLPQLSLEGGYTYNSVEAIFELPAMWHVRDGILPNSPMYDPGEPMSPDNPPGLPTRYFLYPAMMVDAVLQKHHQVGGAVKLEQAILAPALIPAFRQARLARDAAELSVEHAQQEILYNVARLYFGALGLKEAYQVRGSLLETLVAHEENARQRHAIGAAPHIDVLRAELARTEAEKEAVESLNAFLSARYALAALLDREADFDLTHPPAVELPAALEGDEGQLSSQRADLRAAETQLELARHVKRWDWTAYAPNIGLTGQYQLSNIQGFFDAYGLWSVGVGLSWNLFDGGLRESQLRENTAARAQAEAESRALANQARSELQRAALDLKTARAKLEFSEKQLELARAAFDITSGTFNAGAATWLDLSDAKDSLLKAELGKVAEELNLQIATLEVLRAAGMFEL